MKYRNLTAWILLIVIWSAAAWHTGNEILLPGPLETAEKFIAVLTDPVSYQAIGLTLLRVGRGLMISLASALVISLLCRRSIWLRALFHPIRILTKTIPNISYMILAIIWLGSEGAVTAVSFMVLFPLFFNSFMDAMDGEAEEIRQISVLYRDTWFNEIRYHDLPLLKYVIVSACRTAVAFGFKVGIMAEIIGSVRNGAGRQMRAAYINLDTASVLAWTVLIILISSLSDVLFDRISRTMRLKEGLS